MKETRIPTRADQPPQLLLWSAEAPRDKTERFAPVRFFVIFPFKNNPVPTKIVLARL